MVGRGARALGPEGFSERGACETQRLRRSELPTRAEGTASAKPQGRSSLEFEEQKGPSAGVGWGEGEWQGPVSEEQGLKCTTVEML